MITFIAVMVVVNFILLCVNEYGSLHRSKTTIEIMNRYISETQEMVMRVEGKVDELKLHLVPTMDEEIKAHREYLEEFHKEDE